MYNKPKCSYMHTDTSVFINDAGTKSMQSDEKLMQRC